MVVVVKNDKENCWCVLRGYCRRSCRMEVLDKGGRPHQIISYEKGEEEVKRNGTLEFYQT